MYLKNVSQEAVKVRGSGVTIAAGESYKVEGAYQVNFAKDICVRMAIHAGKLNLLLLSEELAGEDAQAWLDRYAQGMIDIS